jgi:hypothetical protein
VYIIYNYATMNGPLLDLWVLVLGGGCANVGFLVPTTMHLTDIVSPNGSVINLCILTH